MTHMSHSGPIRNAENIDSLLNMSDVLMGNTVRNHNKVTVNYDHQPPPMNEQRLVSNANELLQVKMHIFGFKFIKMIFRCSRTYPEQQ